MFLRSARGDTPIVAALDKCFIVAESGCRSILFLKENSAYEEKWEGTKFGTRQEPQVEFSVKVAIA
jgi:hypothetical protein